jgi:hypothetical protein
VENSSKLGGIRLRQPLPRSEELLCHVREALTPDWRNFLICIDGADGIGKSSLASWHASRASPEHHVTTLGPGSCLGERALIEDELRNAFVAAEEVESYAVGRTDFWRLKGQILNFRMGQSSPVSELTLPS